jgi:hypothetical protein
MTDANLHNQSNIKMTLLRPEPFLPSTHIEVNTIFFRHAIAIRITRSGSVGLSLASRLTGRFASNRIYIGVDKRFEGWL